MPPTLNGLAEPNVEERLQSWKEIGAYLKRDVRTVRRWEADEGLPVHRHGHKKLPSVYAYKPELDQWRGSREKELAPVQGAGLIDEVQLYNRALAASEIQNLAANNAGTCYQ